jgi:hypothetical protein
LATEFRRGKRSRYPVFEPPTDELRASRDREQNSEAPALASTAPADAKLTADLGQESLDDPHAETLDGIENPSRQMNGNLT